MNIKKLLLRSALLIPLILGTLGFLSEGSPFNDALFSAITLYALEYGDGGNNLLVEIARWTAPLATASGLLILLSQLRERLHDYLLYRQGKAVAVYGSNRDTARLLRQLGDCGIEGGSKLVKAQKYILAGDEAFNLAFYNRHREKLENSSVYLKCSTIPAQSSSPANLRLYSPEETAARLFWKRSNVLALSEQNGHRMNIVILGFGRLGEHLLTTALQQNIFHPDQAIAYHVFGNDDGFIATHRQLKEISDPVTFYTAPWYDHSDLLDKAAMVRVAEQENQTALVGRLLSTLTRETVHVFAEGSFGLEILDEQDRLQIFRWKTEAASPEQIFSTKLYEDAMQLNLSYAVRYSDSAGTAEEEWAKLNGFTRYSNISSADYFEVLRALLGINKQPDSYAALSDDWIEHLAELEHIRWCRYHYLHNWSCGIPENGKAKDSAKRIHRSLIPYAQLTENEKMKDRENIEMMFSLTNIIPTRF